MLYGLVELARRFWSFVHVCGMLGMTWLGMCMCVCVHLWACECVCASACMHALFACLTACLCVCSVHELVTAIGPSSNESRWSGVGCGDWSISRALRTAPSTGLAHVSRAHVHGRSDTEQTEATAGAAHQPVAQRGHTSGACWHSRGERSPLLLASLVFRGGCARHIPVR